MAATYVASYAYLAWYHQTLFLFDTLVHENGQLTLLQSLFYASHFLGHVPVLTVLAVYFAGACLWLCAPTQDGSTRTVSWLIVALILLLSCSMLVSFLAFGTEDTVSFIVQKKQSPVSYETAGAWNLHLPSTVLQLALIPAYIYWARRGLGRAIEPGPAGRRLMALGIGGTVVLTLLFNGSHPGAALWLWLNPRYLAHGVREMVTFPLTYYPIVLYVLFRAEGATPSHRGAAPGLAAKMIALGLMVVVGMGIMSYASLSAGIGELAQKPAFARDGRLGIPYLLASHYFEHVLDTIYFALVALLVVRLAQRRRGPS